MSDTTASVSSGADLRTDGCVTVRILSFSYLRGIPEDPWGHGGGFVFDCRGLPNPFWEERLRKCTGKDPEIAAFFDRHREAVDAFAGAAEALIRQTVQTFQRDGRRHLQVAFGCTGGQHRSVFMAEELGRRLRGMPGVETEVVHLAESTWKRK